MMSRPLILFLQLVGFFVFIFGLSSESFSWGAVGILMIIVGGIGRRKRFKTK